MKDSALKFEQAVRDYLNGSRDWEGVHELAVEMEWLNEAEFPAHLGRPMEELQMIFLVDGTDDPQFRADREEIATLLEEVDRKRKDAKDPGGDVLPDREC